MVISDAPLKMINTGGILHYLDSFHGVPFGQLCEREASFMLHGKIKLAEINIACINITIYLLYKNEKIRFLKYVFGQWDGYL
jgi:hypothetical protein